MDRANGMRRRAARRLARPALAGTLLVALAGALLGSSRPALWAQGDDGASYFADLDHLSGYPLRHALHRRISGHTRIPYRGAGIDARSVLAEADRDLADPLRLRAIYSNRAVTATDTAFWNREHAWPRSMGFRDDDACNLPFADLHALFVSVESHNFARKNFRYDDCAAGSGCKTYEVDGHPDAANVMDSSAKTWEVWDERKGDVARALLYMDVRYEGGAPPPGCEAGEPQLVLTDDVSRIVSTNGNADVAYMGMLGTLLRWHEEDPPDARDRQRDDAIYGYQRNRNPFVTHPEWAERVWGTTYRVWLPVGLNRPGLEEENPAGDPSGTPFPDPVPTTTPAPRLVIEHVHYDGLMPRTESDEYALLRNVGATAVELLDWRLNAGDPGQDVLLTQDVLRPGDGCRIYTDEVHEDSCAGMSFGRGSPVWNNDGDCGYLFDPAGDEADAYCYDGR